MPTRTKHQREMDGTHLEVVHVVIRRTLLQWGRSNDITNRRYPHMSESTVFSTELLPHVTCLGAVVKNWARVFHLRPFIFPVCCDCFMFHFCLPQQLYLLFNQPLHASGNVLVLSLILATLASGKRFTNLSVLATRAIANGMHRHTRTTYKTA